MQLRQQEQLTGLLSDPAYGKHRAGELALEEFVRDVNLQGKKELVLILDNAGWPRTKGLRVPQGLRLVYPPAYTPELSPAEPVVPLLREAVAKAALGAGPASTGCQGCEGNEWS
ncbi:MAG: hypothetical protein C4331_18615 [Meiothermus sp.]